MRKGSGSEKSKRYLIAKFVDSKAYSLTYQPRKIDLPRTYRRYIAKAELGHLAQSLYVCVEA